MSNYISIATKIKAMQKHLLKDSDYEKLAKFNSLIELVEYLKLHPTYEPYFTNLNTVIVHRAEIEKRLYWAFNEEFTKVYKFANLETRKFLKAYAFGMVTLFIRNAMHAQFRNIPSEVDLRCLYKFFEHYTDINPHKLREAKSIPELLDTLKNSKLYDGLKSIYDTTGEQMIYFETYLDSYFFSKMWSLRFKLTNKKDIDYIKKLYGTTIDLVNIMTIYRSKKYYNLQDSNIIPFLLPINYNLTKDDINALIHSENVNACIEAINKTKYTNLTKDLNKRTIGSVAFEILSHLQRKNSKNNLDSLASVGSYFFFKRQEIYSLITITEGLKYNIGEKEIKKYFTIY